MARAQWKAPKKSELELPPLERCGNGCEPIEGDGLCVLIGEKWLCRKCFFLSTGKNWPRGGAHARSSDNRRPNPGADRVSAPRTRVPSVGHPAHPQRAPRAGGQEVDTFEAYARSLELNGGKS